MPFGAGKRSDYNVFLEGAKPSVFGDEHSVVTPEATGLAIQDDSRGATILFSVPGAALGAKGPQVNADWVSVFSTVGQTIEDRYGRPIAVDRDINGQEFLPAVVGPLADLKPGRNAIRWR